MAFVASAPPPAHCDTAVSRPVSIQWIPGVSPADSGSISSRAASVQYLPAVLPPAVGFVASRAASIQDLPAVLPPPSDQAIARSFTIQPAGIPLVVPDDVPDVAPATSAERQGFDSAFPNPFRRATAIRYSLPTRTYVRLTVFDPAGRVCRRLVDQVEDAGEHVLRWDGSGTRGERLSPGVYLCRLQAGSFTGVRRIALLDL